MKVLILAGGYATRLWPLTEKRAKPLLLVQGKTILEHILEKIPKDFDVFVLTNKKFEIDFQKEIQKQNRKNIQIFCEDSFSDGQKLGALGAISLFIQEVQIKENLLIFAGDNILTDLNVESLRCDENSAHIVTRNVESFFEARKFGVVEVDSTQKNTQKKDFNLEKVINFEEKPKQPKSKTVLTGFLSLGKNLLPILHQYAQKAPDALGGIFIELLRQKKTIWAHTIEGKWFDVGSFETYLQAHKELQTEPILKSQNTTEEKNIYQGKVYIGEGSTIENCRITDAIIYPNNHLKNCHISHAIIDKDCFLEGVDINQKLIRQKTKLQYP